MQNYTISWQNARTNKTTTRTYNANSDKEAIELGAMFLQQEMQNECIKQLCDEIAGVVK
jgi:uncharacterized protein with gpF-like domain